MLLIIGGKPISPKTYSYDERRTVPILTACKYCDCEDYLNTVVCCRSSVYLEQRDFLDTVWRKNYCILWRPRCY